MCRRCRAVPLYADKAKVIAHLQNSEKTGLSWTAIHTGQFFDWGLESGWLDFDLKNKKATIYDSGHKAWSTSTLQTASAAVVKVLLNPTKTKNRPIFVASFTISQRQLLKVLERATDSVWQVDNITSKEALEKAEELDRQQDSAGLKLRVMSVLYGEDAETGANFEENGSLANDLLQLPAEDLNMVVDQVILHSASL